MHFRNNSEPHAGPPISVFKALPEVWELIRPRRRLLALGLVLMVINSVTGLVLPASTKFLVDDVIGKHHASLLMPLVGMVLLSTLVQGLTSFALTQTLSKAAQRLIAELRSRVQEHVGRLTLQYFDSTKVGTLVSRIMTDVEGVRNLIGTGLIDFVGGLLTAVIAFVVLVRISPVMTAIAFGFLLVFGVALRKAFQTIRPIFRERGKINAEVTGRLTESLGGVRVVKGYHAEAREHEVFAVGIETALAKCLPDADGNVAARAFLCHADGRGGSDRHVHGLAADSCCASSPSAVSSLTPCFSDTSPRRSFRWSESEPRLPRHWRDWSALARCSTSIPKMRTRSARSASAESRARSSSAM